MSSRARAARIATQLLPPILLERLRSWWRHAHAAGKILPGGYLFPGLDPMDPMSTRQLNRAVHEAAAAAHIDKRVSMHSLRHPFATHLLEARSRGFLAGGLSNACPRAPSALDRLTHWGRASDRMNP